MASLLVTDTLRLVKLIIDGKTSSEFFNADVPICEPYNVLWAHRRDCESLHPAGVGINISTV